MKGPITIDAGADIKQLEDVDVITIHNKYSVYLDLILTLLQLTYCILLY